MNQMEIATALMEVSFALFLAALAAAPTLIGVYLEQRTRKHQGAQQNVSESLGTYPPPVPFNYPQISGRSTPGVASTSLV